MYRHLLALISACVVISYAVAAEPVDPETREATRRVIAKLSKHLTNRPDDADALAARGLANFHGGDNVQAIADFTAALKIRPSDPKLYYHRFLAYARSRNTQKAKLDVEKMQAVDKGKCYRTYTSIRYAWPRLLESDEPVWLLSQQGEEHVAAKRIHAIGVDAAHSLVAALWDPTIASNVSVRKYIANLLSAQGKEARKELNESFLDWQQLSRRVNASMFALEDTYGPRAARESYGALRNYLDGVQDGLQLALDALNAAR